MKINKSEERVENLYDKDPDLYQRGMDEIKKDKKKIKKLSRYLLKNPRDAFILNKFLSNGYLLHELSSNDLSALTPSTRLWLEKNGYTNNNN